MGANVPIVFFVVVVVFVGIVRVGEVVCGESGMVFVCLKYSREREREGDGEGLCVLWARNRQGIGQRDSILLSVSELGKSRLRRWGSNRRGWISFLYREYGAAMSAYSTSKLTI